MFVEAFSPSLVNVFNPMSLTSPSPLSIRHRTKALFSATPEATTLTALIHYKEESQHHIVTLPSFAPANEQHDDGYPSLLHQIHILPLLTDEETSKLLQLARAYATENLSWDQQDSSRHVSYQTVDFAIEEAIEISQYLGASGIQFEDRVFGALSEAYDVDVEDLSFLDLFCASYEVKETDSETNDSDEERNTMDRLDFHRDGSLLSFTILLSPLEDFEGGGTIFDALGDVATGDDKNSIIQPSGVIQPPDAGYATLHSGKLLHGGHVITKGQRVVLVGFVDVHERNMKSGALGNATKEWGRNDVREFWNQRRSSLLKQQGKVEEKNEQPVWKLKNWRYLPKDTKERRASSNEGRSYFGENSEIPPIILNNVEKRASLEKIRRRRLITEDKLLREIVLPREERGEKIDDEEEGEWREVDLDSMDGLMLGWDENDVNVVDE